jgi:hypothetical protein
VKCDAVFEGGGVKGIAFVGAIQETEKRGYSFNQLAYVQGLKGFFAIRKEQSDSLRVFQSAFHFQHARKLQ